jgi:hypothetical protein
VEKVPGRILTIQNSEVTTLLEKQVNIVSIKNKISKELWGFQKELLPTLWIMYKGERMMVQYYRNVISLTSKSINRDIELNAPIISLMRSPMFLVFVCPN